MKKIKICVSKEFKLEYKNSCNKSFEVLIMQDKKNKNTTKRKKNKTKNLPLALEGGRVGRAEQS